MSKKLELDFDVADRITLLTLKSYRNDIKKEIKRYKQGEYVHPNDVAADIKRVEALDLIIKDFGG